MGVLGYGHLGGVWCIFVMDHQTRMARHGIVSEKEVVVIGSGGGGGGWSGEAEPKDEESKCKFKSKTMKSEKGKEDLPKLFTKERTNLFSKFEKENHVKNE